MLATPIACLPVGNVLGEGVQWNPADGCFWWTDIQARRLYRHDLAAGTTRWTATPERLGSFCFVAGRDDLILAAFETGFALFAPDSGEIRWLHRPEVLGGGRRFNDGRPDRQGRFWAGTMVEDAGRAGTDSASLYCLDRQGQLHRVVDGIAISNGLSASPDGRHLYFADSPKRRIDRYGCDAATVALTESGTFATTVEGEYPDGATVDADGHLWSAQWGGWKLARFAPDGQQVGHVALPVEQPTCMAFGGPDLDILCVTTARDGLSDAALARQPEAGHAFLFKLTTTGLPDARWSGTPATG